VSLAVDETNSHIVTGDSGGFIKVSRRTEGVGHSESPQQGCCAVLLSG